MKQRFVSKAAILWSNPQAGACIECERQVGSGPVGFRLEEPQGLLCDSCTLACERGLGLVLKAVNLLREMAQVEPKTADEHNQRLVYLMTFAALYDQSEQKRWQVRPIGWMEVVEDVDRYYGEMFGVDFLREVKAGKVDPRVIN